MRKAYHSRLGHCVIERVLPNAQPPRVVVRFLELGYSSTCPLSDLRDDATGQPITLDAEPRAAAPPSPAPAAPPRASGPRTAILALRLGQCPDGYLDRLTVGAAEVRAACEWALERSHSGRPAFLLFESPYGKGKTHALNLFAHVARSRQRAVGAIVLDGCGVSLSQPMSLLTELAGEIRFPDDDLKTLPERLAGLVSGGRAEELRTYGADYLTECLRHIPAELAENPEAWDLIVDYLSCEVSAAQARTQLRQYLDEPRPFQLQPIATRARDDRPGRCVMMLREWAHACAKLGASRGLVLLFDEADVDYGATGFSYGVIEQRRGVLDALRQLAEDPRTRSYLSAAFAITPGRDPFWDEDPVEELLDALGEENVRRVALPDVRRADLLELATRITALYAEAYETSPVWDAAQTQIEASDIADRLSRSRDGCVPRVFIRELLEKLDLAALRH